MKNLIYVLVWSVAFIIFGIYVTVNVSDFTEKYTEKIEIVGIHIISDDWDTASKDLDSLHKEWHKERKRWYKLLNHEYFDAVCLDLEILSKNILVQDKSKALEKIEYIKSNLSNILESDRCDSNHIF